MTVKPYTDFAAAYDQVLKHVDYDRWYHYLRELMLRYCENPVLVLELGCGTGKFGARFSRDDFIVYGMDISLPMLRMAGARAYRNFHLFCGDMRAFHLKKRFDFIFCVHDTLNYLLKYTDIRMVLRSVRGVMHEKSIFMFDVTTEHNIKHFFDNRVSSYRVRDMAVEWTNRYDPLKRIVHSRLTFHKPDGSVTGETHVQRIYSTREIRKLCESEGMAIVDIFSDYSFSPPLDSTVMINFVAMKA